MKLLFKIPLSLISLFACVFVLASCDRQPAATPKKTTTPQCPTCVNGGTCVNDSCVCPAGYEGLTCETASRQKFIGNWTVSEKGSLTAADQYSISITEGTGISDVKILNFYNYFSHPIAATVFHDTLYISNQQLEGKVVFGIGYIYSSAAYGQYGAINMAYEIIDTATQAINDFGYNSSVDHSSPSAWNK